MQGYAGRFAKRTILRQAPGVTPACDEARP
jgi:hypothetical protein